MTIVDRIKGGTEPLRVIGAHRRPRYELVSWAERDPAPRGDRSAAPALPDARRPMPEGQSLAAWLASYDHTARALPLAPTLFVGHSLGVAFALRLVERATTPFAGLMLTAGFVGALGLPDYDGINHSFFATPFDWAGIRAPMGKDARCWAADDDHYVPLPLARSQALAEQLHLPLDIVPGGGHLSDDTGFTRFPTLCDAILAARQALTV